MTAWLLHAGFDKPTALQPEDMLCQMLLHNNYTWAVKLALSVRTALLCAFQALLQWATIPEGPFCLIGSPSLCLKDNRPEPVRLW